MDSDRPGRVLAGLGSFLAAGPASPTDPRQQVVELFHRVAVSVPAYRAFLREHGVDPGEVRTLDGLRAPAAHHQGELPPALPAAERVPRRPARRLRHDRGLVRLDRASRRSGRASSPTSWRSRRASSRSFARQLRRPTSARRSRWSASRSAPGSAACSRPAAAGTSRRRATRSRWSRRATTRPRSCASSPELGRALRADGAARLSAVPEGRDRHRAARAGVDWTRCAIKLVLAGEVFSEEWRDAGRRAAGLAAARASTPRRCTAPPTPACSATRRRCRSPSAASSPPRPDAARELFGEVRLPTLVQYDPASASSRRTTARCCSRATTACRSSATTSPTRAA